MFFSGTAAAIASGGDAVATTAAAAAPVAIRVALLASHRIYHVREVISSLTDLPLAAIEDWLEEDDAHLDFFTRVLEAAARAGLEEKRVALGRIASRAMEDDAYLDESLMFLKAVDDCEGPHIRILVAMAAPRHGRGQLADDVVTGQMGLQELADMVHAPPSVLRSAIALLQSHGAIVDSAPATWDQLEGEDRWIVSDFGRDLVEFLTIE